jgi:RNA processing factor Prp31
LTLEDFYKFKSTADAFKCISKLMKGKIPKSLSKFLTKNVVEKEIQETLAIADKKMGKALTEELGLVCKQNDSIDELMRVIRFNIAGLLNRSAYITQLKTRKTTK